MRARKLNRWADENGPLIALVGVLLTASAVGVAILALRSDGNEESLNGGRTIAEANETAQSFVPGPASGWFDSGGNRSGIEYADENTPWRDQASFNNLVGTPSYGDERAFMDARLSSNTQAGAYTDDLAVSDGDVVTLRIYVHNTADPAVNQSAGERGTAVNTRVRVVASRTPLADQQLLAYIRSDNADPEWVADRTVLRSATPFTVQLVPGSGKIFTNQLGDPLQLDDSVFATGNVGVEGPAATIGLDALDGRFEPLGFDAEATVQLEVLVVAARS